MTNVLREIVRSGYPVVTPFARDLYRLKYFVTFSADAVLQGLKWYLGSREYTNFTYSISEKSKKYLAALLANVFRVPLDRVSGYFEELEGDHELRDFLRRQVRQSRERYFADLPIKYGRRVGWYAIVRLLRPRVVVESGVDRGVGTCVLAAALLRNGQEGAAGQVFGLDIDPLAGSYVAGPYEDVVHLIHGDSLTFLDAMTQDVDVFIHDSDHSPVHETAEYESVFVRLSPQGVLVTDNGELTDCLFEFARRNVLSFWHWREEAIGHIYRGGGIGLAMREA